MNVAVAVVAVVYVVGRGGGERYNIMICGVQLMGVYTRLSERQSIYTRDADGRDDSRRDRVRPARGVRRYECDVPAINRQDDIGPPRRVQAAANRPAAAADNI